jgi:hypothetical protein
MSGGSRLATLVTNPVTSGESLATALGYRGGADSQSAERDCLVVVPRKAIGGSSAADSGGTASNGVGALRRNGVGALRHPLLKRRSHGVRHPIPHHPRREARRFSARRPRFGWGATASQYGHTCGHTPFSDGIQCNTERHSASGPGTATAPSGGATPTNGAICHPSRSFVPLLRSAYVCRRYVKWAAGRATRLHGPHKESSGDQLIKSHAY